jgi:hypothetical protein
MARAHQVRRAQKDYPDHGIKKGEPYWWWKFMVGGRGGPKHYSKTQPKPSQLTQSEFLGELYSIQEDVEAAKAEEGLEDVRDDAVSRLNDLADEQDSKLSNMPDSLQQGPSGELLTERAEACRSAASELENLTLDDSDKEDGESDEDYWTRKLGELQDVSIDAS